MLSTLFHIPHTDPFFQFPIFGIGWVLLVWAVGSSALMIWSVRKYGWNEQTRGQLPVLLVLGAAIAWVAPMLEEQTAAGVILGLPIRGYGVMVMLGVVCGVGLIAQLGRRMGIDPDTFFSLAFWVFVAGIIGARAFYVIEYWEEFSEPRFADTVVEILKFTQGGLVVYGSFTGATIAAVIFLRRRRLPILAIGDIVAPGLMLGLALGRIGCLLNGCCWGGICGDSQIGITFPPGSPPFIDQLENGSMVGMKLVRDLVRDPDGLTMSVREVIPGSKAEQQGFRVGDTIIGLNTPTKDEYRENRQNRAKSAAQVIYTTGDYRRVSWKLNELSPRSLSVYPTQILSSLNAAIICCFLWVLYPFRRRDGVVLAWLLTIYPVTRFLLEMIRTDEASVIQASFKFTVSQAVSCILLALVVAMWGFILSRPRGLAFPGD